MIDFDVVPYFDDTAAPGGAIDNNYMRILFRPDSYAVQARELTALQSILQNQISSIGGFIFQNGSPVSGGHVSVDTSVVAIQLQQQYANVDIDLTNFLVNGNSTLIVNVSGTVTVKAVVVAIDDTQTNPTILVKYLTGNKFNDGDVIQVATGLQTQAQLITSNASTGASVASINEGVFYSGGFFVKVPAQTIVLDSTTTTPTYRVGLQISEAIVDEITDTNLLDPAQGSFNYQAPGATRYQYNLSLTKRTLNSVDTSAFYELIRVENGLITQQVDYPVFADLDKSLAQRTYDTSGDFTVKAFSISTSDYPQDNTKYQLVIEPGKAYVKGFEFETVGTQKIINDKALTTNTITDYGMSLDYGNILTVTNLYGGNSSGIFDITQFQSVDLHIVPSANIATNLSAAYSNTKIGTAKIRDIEFLGLNNYYVYVHDVNIQGLNFIASGGSENTITLPANATNYPNAYANVLVTVSTAGIIDQRTIVSYNATTKVATLNQNLSIAANNTSNVTLNYGIKDCNSLVVTPSSFGSNVYYTQNSTSAILACMDIAVAGKTPAGNTVLTDTQFNSMVYPLPHDYVAQGTITNATFYHRKNLWSQTFTSGNLTISSGSGLGTGESFAYGFTNQYLPDVTANNNFIVVVKNALSSNLSNGQIIQFNKGSVTGGNGVFQTSSNSVTIAVGTNGTFIGDVLFTVEVSNASQAAVARRSKTLIGNTSNVVLLSTDSYLNGLPVIGTAVANSIYIDSANGYVWLPNTSTIIKTPNSPQYLGLPDVINVIKVYDSGNSSFAPNSTNALDITANYYLDSGQRDNYYDHASLILKPGVSPPTGQVMCILQYYQHDSVSGFFDADSYSSTAYSLGLIPIYNSPNFGSINLRDSIDFRPTRTIGTTANVATFNLTGLNTPYPDNPIVLSYQFYLPRIDKLVLSKDKSFKIIQGVPAVNPTTPADLPDAMTLYIVSTPAYTPNVSQIGLQYIENKRYTMRDIGVLDKRIQRLEYYSSLSQLESNTRSILYSDGVTAKPTYGLIADNFGDFSVADNQNFDLLCFLANNSMTPYKSQVALQPNFVSASGGNYNENDKVFSLSYTETPVLTQNAASTYVSVQPYLFGQFKGTVKLTPSTDSFFNANLIPMVIAVSAPPSPPTPTKYIPATLGPPKTTVTPQANVVVTKPTTTIVSSYTNVGNRQEYIEYGPAGYLLYGPRYTTNRIGINYLGYGYLNIGSDWYAPFGAGNGNQVSTAGTPLNLNSGGSIQLQSAKSPQSVISGGYYGLNSQRVTNLG